MNELLSVANGEYNEKILSLYRNRNQVRVEVEAEDLFFSSSSLTEEEVAEIRGFSEGWRAAICRAMSLISKSSILSPTQKKLLWKEVKKLKGV